MRHPASHTFSRQLSTTFSAGPFQETRQAAGIVRSPVHRSNGTREHAKSADWSKARRAGPTWPLTGVVSCRWADAPRARAVGVRGRTPSARFRTLRARLEFRANCLSPRAPGSGMKHAPRLWEPRPNGGGAAHADDLAIGIEDLNC